MAAIDHDDARAELVATLLDKVKNDRYPSTTMLDLIEQSMGPDNVEQYAEALLDKIKQDQFPSVALMDRLRALL